MKRADPSHDHEEEEDENEINPFHDVHFDAFGEEAPLHTSVGIGILMISILKLTFQTLKALCIRKTSLIGSTKSSEFSNIKILQSIKR